MIWNVLEFSASQIEGLHWERKDSRRRGVSRVNGSCCCWEVGVVGGDCGVPGDVDGSRPATNITGNFDESIIIRLFTEGQFFTLRLIQVA
jgi:hypothetical protein